jgi:hypothetical protein
MSLEFLGFEFGDDGHGVVTLEAMASTSTAQHGAVMDEVQRVLDWAWTSFAHTHGPVDEGLDWDHDLQVHDEGGWRVVTLTLTASERFAQAFFSVFGDPREG